jgi:ADP-heptose:LPS heptosyltransferase/Tfp pilus assembly protein PilF
MLKHLDNQQQDDYTLALKYKTEKQYNLSIEMYNKILLKDPYNTLYLEELADQHNNLEQIEKSIECYNKIRIIEPNNGVNLNNLGICYFKLNKYEIAIDFFKKILIIKNDIPDVYNNICGCYVGLKQYKLAENVLNISLKLRQDENVYYKLANLYFYMKKYEESIVYYNKLSKTVTNLYNKCFPYLALDKFKIGFKLYENRLLNNNIHPQTKQKERVEIPQIRDWDGIAPCNNLLVIYEQGIGDNFQYYRFMIELSLKYPDMKITYFCKTLVSNILRPYHNITIKTTDVDIRNFDYKMFIMSLPSFLQIETIAPNVENYIIQNDEKIDYWKKQLSPLKKYKIGFLHNGLLSSFIEKSIPLIEFEKLTELGLDIDLICISKLSDVKNEINTVKNIKFFDIDKDIPFQDTVAILQNIDLLITIDTSIVHLAGVMGIPTWLLLGYGSDWRWSNKSTTYWYKSVELMRMTENIDLKNIMKDVKKKLIEFIEMKNNEFIIYI